MSRKNPMPLILGSGNRARGREKWINEKLGLLKDRRDAKDKVQEALRAVGMDAYMNRNIGELSGGQQQRVLLQEL